MAEFIGITFCNSICPLVMIITAAIMALRPCEFGGSFGYRTQMSMKNELTWYSAQAYFSKICLISNIPTLIISAAITIILLNTKLSENDLVAMIIVVTFIQAAVVIGDIIATERYLKKRFDSRGNPKV